MILWTILQVIRMEVMTSDMMDTDPTQFKGPDLNQGGSNNAQNSKGL